MEGIALLEEHAVTGEELDGRFKLILKRHGVIDRVSRMQDVNQPRSLKVGKSTARKIQAMVLAST